MSDLEDEYDASYSPLDLEGFNSQSPPSRHVELTASAPASQATAPQASDDEFDAYDFSEFTAADFAQIDAELAAAYARPMSDSDNNGDKPGGPAIDIKLEEEPADHSTLVKAPKPRASLPPSRRDTRSPFKRFRNWNKYFSVSDLVGPSWCEVQFDYGLRQKRWLKPEERPDTFVTQEGKTITVDKGVAVQNFRTAARGQSVHKALEREVKPEEIVVEITTQEERWGIRLVNMLACLDMLIESGLCREMPVFGIVHDQIVVGIIDELVRKPAPSSTPEPRRRRGRPPGSGKGPNKRASPSTPTKGSGKKSRMTPEPNQPALTSYFHMAVQVPERENASSAFAVRSPAGTRHTTPSEVDSDADLGTLRGAAWVLHISDTKTRRTASLPPEEDTLSARLQLMLYHRLLSSLLQPPAPSSSKARKSLRSPPSVDFAEIWVRLGLDAQKPFSARFVRDAGLAPGACLADLVQTWQHTAAALDVGSVDRTLTLVYRLQPAAARQIRERERAEREGAELARAIEASLNAAPNAWAGGDDDLARAIGASMRGIEGKEGSVATIGHAPPDMLIPSAGDLEGAQDTVPHALVPAHEGAACGVTDSSCASGEEDEVQITAAELDVKARILGSKEFTADDQALDSYLDTVLRWWLGERPPKGVDMDLTRRCLTCEYLDGCEWRAKKALEHHRQAASKT